MTLLFGFPVPGAAARIYGCLRGSLRRPLLVFVHGLTSSMNHHLLFNGARFFEKQGYASFRFNLYGEQPDAHKLGECSLRTHASDVDTVVRFFRRKGVRTIIPVGHSYGCFSILFSKEKDFSAIVLWDPSHRWTTEEMFDEGTYLPSLKMYRFHWPVDTLLSKKMIETDMELDWGHAIQTFHVPIKIIAAGNGPLVKTSRDYYRTQRRHQNP